MFFRLRVRRGRRCRRRRLRADHEDGPWSDPTAGNFLGEAAPVGAVGTDVAVPAGHRPGQAVHRRGPQGQADQGAAVCADRAGTDGAGGARRRRGPARWAGRRRHGTRTGTRHGGGHRRSAAELRDTGEIYILLFFYCTSPPSPPPPPPPPVFKIAHTVLTIRTMVNGLGRAF